MPSIEERLRAKGEGEVSLVVLLGAAAGEVEIKLPGRFAVSAAIAGALKAVAGVVRSSTCERQQTVVLPQRRSDPR